MEVDVDGDVEVDVEVDVVEGVVVEVVKTATPISVEAITSYSHYTSI